VSELLQSVERLFSDIPDAVRLLDRGGELLYRNAAALTLPTEGLGHLCKQEGSRGSSCPACRIKEVLEKGVFQRWHVVYSPREQPDSEDYYEVTLCPIRDAEGRVCAVLEVLRDESANLGLQHYLIGRSERQDTEIHRRSVEAEKLVERADHLSSELGSLKENQTEVLYEDRLSALGQVVAGLAHEMHTPLGAILSSSDLLQRSLDRLQSGLDESDGLNSRIEALKGSAEIVGEGARRIHGVLRALLNFSRLDEAPCKRVTLEEGVESTLKILQYRMGDRIRVSRRYGVPVPITCRPDALNQVFMNLLLNAVQSIPENGEITVETGADGGQAVVRIGDNGVGMDEETRARVFDLGFSTRKKSGGSGLGLPLCRRIVAKHGGTIEVDSRPGEGSTFTVRLPIDPNDGGEG
jgi:signal transduction histidine kinase